MKFKKAVVPLVALATGCGLLVWSSGVASAAPGAPTNVKIARDAADPSKITIGWAMVEGAARYNVSVFDGATDNVTVLPATKTTFAVQKTDPCARLKVTVGSRDRSGAGATSGNIWVQSLAPGGVSGVRAQRDPSFTALTVTWKAPAWAGEGQFGGYQVNLIRSSDNVVVGKVATAATTTTFDKLDPAAEYRLEVAAGNRFGTCITNRMPIGSSKASAPGSMHIDRDEVDKSKITLTWNTPAYAGYDAITHYLVGAAEGTADPTTWTKISADTTSVTLNLNPAKKWNIQVVPHNSFGAGRIGVARVAPEGSGLGIKPLVNLSLTGEQVNVKLGTKVGAVPGYPNVVVRVRSLIASDMAFYDEQWGQTGATAINFTNIPAGIYLATVSGSNAAFTSEEEWARQIMIVGPNTGALQSSSWQSTLAVKSSSGDGNVISRTGTSSNSQALLATVTTKSNRGYGMWVRASVSPLKLLTGYLVEYDPNFLGQGPTYLLRMQKLGVPCLLPLATSKAPAATTKAGVHQVAVVVSGDSLAATVDNIAVLNVPNLTAVNNKSCLTNAPIGTQVGLRTWKQDGIGAYSNVTLR